MSDVLIEVRNLKTYFPLSEGTVKAVDGVSFDINKGESLGIVGESGCGKSITALSILQVVPWPGRVVAGDIIFHPEQNQDTINIARLDPQGSKIRNVRGAEISMIFQEPLSAFSPLYTVGNQITESMFLHIPGITKEKAREKAVELLREVGIPRAEKRLDSYPFQLSGGMRQRAMIAMALSCNPKLLIADEPTTAIDVTIQAQILELLKRLQQEFGMAIMMITHDLGVIAELCTRVVVMYLGEVVEIGSMVDVYNNTLHPYTYALMESIPEIGGRKDQLSTIAGTIPDPFSRPAGCNFEPRCRRAHEVSNRPEGKKPALVEAEDGHFVRCFLYSSEVKEEQEVTHELQRK